MAWQPGQSGNPEGRRQEAIVRSALIKACAQEDYKRIRQMCEKTLDLAAAGEQWAVNFIADRIDGKPKQVLDVDLSNRPAVDMADAELAAAITSGSSGGTASTQTSASQSP